MIDSRYKLKTGEEVAYSPPIQNTANPYLTEAAMHADQANQLQGYGYLVDGVGAFTYLGTVAETAADYKGFWGGLDLRASNLAGDLSTAEQDGIKTKLAIVEGYSGSVGEIVLTQNIFGTGYADNWTYLTTNKSVIQGAAAGTFETLITGINKQPTLIAPYPIQLVSIKISGYTGPQASPETMELKCSYTDLPVDGGSSNYANPIQASYNTTPSFATTVGYNRTITANSTTIPEGKAIFVGFKNPPDASNGQVQGMIFQCLFRKVTV